MKRDLRLRNDIRDMDAWDMGFYFMALEKEKGKKKKERG
jgi:hypothetical protein